MNIQENIIREKITFRGGGVEISLNSVGFEGEKMTAYQNYLGGGMLGRIANDCTIKNWRDNSELVKIADELSRYMFEVTNPEGDWESTTYEQNQNLPISAY
jgi:hypothetical protein